ncbi:hypothetical protein [Kribbella italica]|uniref:Uncharacterized protein n=1 Tax=Kribbella italica TaxID=1540520 RepID=A0A7W9J6E1_9ACTN|nr:hypothetical protein [Kribbella italica]MBB5835990.1 hypothetical protein [Kribbella italica]
MTAAGETALRVQVWFGEYTIADYIETPALAARYAEAMSTRFPSLRITVTPLPAADQISTPTARLWT